MRFDRIFVFAAAMLLAAATAAQAHSYKQRTLEIVHPWCWETSEPSVAVYMVIHALAKRGDTLTAVSTSIGKAELRPASPLSVKPGKELTLKQGAAHILVSGLTKPLAPYDSFLLTLTFARAGKIEVEVMVEERATKEPAKH
jgi:copper(I)-binding protein